MDDLNATRALLASSRAEVERLTRENARLTDVVDTAVAYVTEPGESDMVPQYRLELEDATTRYLQAGLKPDPAEVDTAESQGATDG